MIHFIKKSIKVVVFVMMSYFYNSSNMNINKQIIPIILMNVQFHRFSYIILHK